MLTSPVTPSAPTHAPGSAPTSSAHPTLPSAGLPTGQGVYSCSGPELTFDQMHDLLRHDARVKVAMIDIDGVFRCKTFLKEKVLSSFEDGFDFIPILFGWDVMDMPYTVPTPFGNAEEGFGDVWARLDTRSFRRLPLEDNMPFFLLRIADRAGRSIPVCPRTVLAKVMREYAELGLEPLCGIELEYFNFRETPQSLAEKEGSKLEHITPGKFCFSVMRPFAEKAYFNDITEKCDQMGIPIEAMHTELGPGVYECALQYTNAMDLADRAAMFKMTVKQVALTHGMIASFMAKPVPNIPGCSGHMHMSIRHLATGANAFFDPLAGPTPEDPYRAIGMSDTMSAFITGLLVGLPSILAILAPTVNSYKRLVENYWAPVFVSWANQQRAAAVRVIIPMRPRAENTADPSSATATRGAP
ncbi:hypothetical protein BJ085DRAFT_38418, partial [Dimargaris cristalligena]